MLPFSAMPPASDGRCRFAYSEREANRLVSCERCSSRELRRESLGPQPIAEALLECEVNCIAGSAEAR